MTAGAAHVLRFGSYELDTRAGELRRGGVLIKMAPQQLRLLRFLAEHAGEVCTRDQLRAGIWEPGTFVDFDRSLTVAIAAIRSVLNDDPESPRYIQTMPRQGYRFIASIDAPEDARPRPRKALPRVKIAIGFVILAAAVTAWSIYFDRGPSTLAVLPFENLTGRAEDAALANGLTDELLTELGAVDPDRLCVMGRTSVARYASTSPNFAQIRRDLHVEYIVEGSLRTEDASHRITVRLLIASTQAQLWSRTYLSGAGTLESEAEIAVQSAVGIAAYLFPPNRPARPRTHTPAPAAREAWLNGRYLLQTRARGSFAAALQQFQLAADRDPNWPDAWAAIAETNLVRALNGAPAFNAAREAADRALRLDEGIAEAHNVLGNVFFWNDWNWRDARRHYDRALALNSSLARAHHDRALLDIVTGQPERGISGLRRAIALDPLSPQVNIDAGWLLLQAHHFAEAERAARRALELEPSFQQAKACIARAQLFSGRPTPSAIDDLRAIATATGSPWYRALAAAAAGQTDPALAALEDALARRDPMLVMLKTEPAFASLAGNARFQKLVQAVGLP